MNEQFKQMHLQRSGTIFLFNFFCIEYKASYSFEHSYFKVHRNAFFFHWLGAHLLDHIEIGSGRVATSGSIADKVFNTIAYNARDWVRFPL